MLLLGALILTPFILLVAGAAYGLGKRYDILPVGVPGIINYALIVCAGYGSLFLFATVESLVYQPARLQEQYLGRSYGTPLSLRYFDQWGFQDPVSQWVYTLRPADARALRKRCKEPLQAGEGDGCLLYSGMDERWFAEVSLRGNQLLMTDGLH